MNCGVGEVVVVGGVVVRVGVIEEVGDPFAEGPVFFGVCKNGFSMLASYSGGGKKLERKDLPGSG